MTDDKFVSGLELSKRFYFEVVEPILNKEIPGLKYSSGLIGYGSEVLGFDTELSIDHHWGPRMLLFISEDDYKNKKDLIDETLSKNLPYTFLGFSTNYSEGDKIGVRHSQLVDKGPIRHFIEFYTVKSYLKKRLGIDSLKSITDKDWMSFSEQRLLETVSGEIFIDKLGTIRAVRDKLKYYPYNIWLIKMAAEWQKISDIEAFVGRSGDVGDEIGSSLAAADIVKSIMKLCFLMEKKYAPYLKWFGSAFKRLESSKQLGPIINKVLTATGWKERQKYLSKAYRIIAQTHNSLNITDKLPEETQDYYGRPYQVIRADLFAEEINKKVEKIKDCVEN